MRTLSNSILRSVCSLVIGVLLVVWPETAMIYLVITIGALFLIPGLISILGYFAHRSGEGYRPVFPVVSLGSALLGLWLMIMPEFFVSILMYLLGAVLVLAGIQLISGLVSTRRYTPVAVGFYVIPVCVLLAGILVLLNPFATASIPFIVLGVSCIFYSLSDLINYFRFRRTPVQEAVVTPVEEVPLIEDEEQDKA